MNDRAWREYSKHFRTKVWPNLYESACLISIAADLAGGKVTLDVIRAATELGSGLLLGKPLLLLVPRGVTLPAGLTRAADAVVYDADMADPTTQDRVVAALRELGVLDQ